MKNKKYSIRKFLTRIISIIIGIGTMKVGIVNAQMESNNKVVISEKGVIPDVEPILPENVKEESVRKPPKEKSLGESSDKSIEKSLIKLAEKLKEKPLGELSDKPIEKPSVKPVPKPIEKPVEKPLGESYGKSTKQSSVKPIEKTKEKSITNASETNYKVEIKNDVLVGNLSGREIKVSFKKGSISAEKLYIESLNDNNLNQTIKNKLGSDYNIIETFEIHFEKDDKRVDSNVERTVTVAVVKKDNAELEVYHIADENTLEKVNSSYGTGELKFNINHFSKFTIVERIKIGIKNIEERVQIEVPESIENKKREYDLPKTNIQKNINEIKILPKTGITTDSEEIIGFVLILFSILIKRNVI